jgi:uncharacterized membrane protein (UPF0127 family)
MVNMIISYRNKKIKVDLRKLSFLGKFSGLMFRSREIDNLLFYFEKDVKIAIHSYFVFFPFLAIWLDKNNRVTEWQIVKPFTSIVRPKRQFRKLVEVPFNNRNRQIIGFFVGKAKI